MSRKKKIALIACASALAFILILFAVFAVFSQNHLIDSKVICYYILVKGELISYKNAVKPAHTTNIKAILYIAF